MCARQRKLVEVIIVIDDLMRGLFAVKMLLIFKLLLLLKMHFYLIKNVNICFMKKSIRSYKSERHAVETRTIYS